MVSHVVVFAPRPDLTDIERRALMDAFARAVRDIPAVRGVRVGRRITHGAGYEQQMPDGFDYLVSIDFDDLAGLQAYLAHPAHGELGARFNQSIASGLVLDFEAGGLEILDSL